MNSHHKRPVRSFALAAVAIALTACTTPAPQPYPLPQPSEPAATPPTTPAIGWNTLLRQTSVPEGWTVYACQNPVLLCVENKGELLGSVELFTTPVQGSEFERMMRDAGVSPDAIDLNKMQTVLNTWINTHSATIQQDREGAGLRFSAQPPKVVAIGNLSGWRYEFATTREDGGLFDRSVGYVTSDGNTLYVIVAALTPGDPAGTFGDDTSLRTFEPHLDRIVAGLNLSAAN